MCQHRWLELIKDYELEIHYHLGKANVVADALSRKVHCLSLSNSVRGGRVTDSDTEDPCCVRISPSGQLSNLILEPSLRDEVISEQRQDAGISHIKRRLKNDEAL